jgi:hypothetical protein
LLRHWFLGFASSAHLIWRSCPQLVLVKFDFNTAQ